MRLNSKACYLHGSFGAGKSHFMAVLHLILQHIAAVRSMPELAKVFAKHTWVENKKFLLVPYHMIGARNMESAVLGGYVDHVMQLHPGAPLPGVYLADEIFKNAAQHRQRLGDEKFFEDLNRGTGRSGCFGLGQACLGLERRPIRGGPGSPSLQRRANPVGGRSRPVHLPRLPGDRPG